MGSSSWILDGDSIYWFLNNFYGTERRKQKELFGINFRGAIYKAVSDYDITDMLYFSDFKEE